MKYLLILLLAIATPPLSAKDIGKTESRSYFFKEAGKEIDYSIYIPPSYDKGKKLPLVVLLHGLGSNPWQVIRYRGIREEAKQRGYIVVAPYGYNDRGWYGSMGKGKPKPPLARRNDPENLGQLSEQDVLNVLEIIRKEFGTDDKRTYLMGHSMGGGGTIHLGATYPKKWAAIAPLSPAIYSSKNILKKLKNTPVMVVSGDQDKLIPVASVRAWVKEMEKLEIEHTYEEIKGGNHYTSIAFNPKMIARVFDFFDKHRR